MKPTVLCRSRVLAATLALAVVLAAQAQHLSSSVSHSSVQAVSKTEFDIVEGVFHDGLGTYAEVALANELIALGHPSQPKFDTSRSMAKMRDAISRLPASHPSRAVFEREITNITRAVKNGAEALLKSVMPASLRLTADRVSFLPSRPRGGHPIASEFGIKIDGRTVVSFQIKHRRGSARSTIHRYEFSDITTRLRI